MNRRHHAFCATMIASTIIPCLAYANERIDFTTGIGFSPLYIEETITNNQLTAGATATPVHISALARVHLSDQLAFSLTSQFDGYQDDQSDTFLNSLLAIGPSIQFNKSYFSIAGGIALKQNLASEQSSTGVGILIHSDHSLGKRFLVEAGFSYSVFEASRQNTRLVQNGDQETISSTFVTVGYQWF